MEHRTAGIGARARSYEKMRKDVTRGLQMRMKTGETTLWVVIVF